MPAGDFDDARLAQLLASEAGRQLVELRRKLAGATELERREAGDRASQTYLAGELARLRPQDAVLSEEALDDPARMSAERVWIIDPLDGTREYSEVGRDDWAVHVALWSSGRLVAGAIALPASGLTLSTRDVEVAPRKAGRLRILVSRTRAPMLALHVCDLFHGELVEMGSAGAKVATVVSGSGDVYLHAGGQYQWDSAAPVAVALAAGLHASRLDGSVLEYNQPDPFLPDLLVCRREFAKDVLTAIALVGGAG